jgi:hypothetical protein
VQRTEEELRAGTREREAGEVGVRKTVRTDRESVEVPARHEEVTVDRIPVEGRLRRPRSTTTRWASPSPRKTAQRSKRTTVIIETRGRGSKRTTVYEEVDEQEW